MDEKIKNLTVALTLALSVLTSWEEDHRQKPGEKIRRAWKGYLFEALDELEQRGLVRASKGVRSMEITEAGNKIGSELVVNMRDALAVFIAGN